MSASVHLGDREAMRLTLVAEHGICDTPHMHQPGRAINAVNIAISKRIAA
jgi:hypothetical protein